MLPRAVCHASGLLRSTPMTCPAAAVQCLVPGPFNFAPGLMLQLSSLEDSASHVSVRRRTILQAAKTAKRRAAVEAPVELDAQDYDASSIQVLEGLEPVRKRPGMYIGNTGQGGLHHLVYEVLDNCIDEVQGGHATLVEMELDLISGWVTVTDNGRGIPTSTHAKTGKSALETVLTVLHAGGKFGGQASGYSVSGGLHGVGISVVNALSEATEVRVWRGGVQYMMSFSRGHAQGPLQQEQLPACDADRMGTQVRFRYDPTIFSSDAVYDPETLRARLRELAFLNSSATLLLRVISPEKTTRKGSRKQRAATSPPAEEHGTNGNGNGHNGNGNGNGVVHANGNGHMQAMNEIELSTVSHVCAWSQEETNNAGSLDGVDVGDGWHAYHFEGGLSEFVASMNADREALHDVIYFSTMVETVGVEVALQWCSDAFTDTLVGFANSIRTVDGGTHLDGTRAAITRTINALAKKLRLVKETDPSLSGDCIREGLVGCVSVKVRDPEFEGQTKTRLGNPEVKRIVDGVVAAALGEWLELRPAALGAIVGKALTAAKAADAAKKARELVRRKAVLTRTTLPGKLADCTSNKRDDTEIFVVEGDSAGGSAKQARDRHTQAILPLRGKILNVERCDEASMLKNNEIANLIVALGLGSKSEGCSGLRYGKVVILTDADVDGAHIRTLLLTFLFRYRRELFEEGHVYVAVPPLYKVEQPQTGRGASAKITWCFSDAHLQEVTQGLSSGSYTVQRFKGLGEMMPEQLWDTTLDPTRRTLRRLTIRDADEASRMFNVLMGSKVAPRRELIQDRGSLFTLKDLDI